MNTRMTLLTVASAVLALSTALSAGAAPSVTDAQTQAGALLTARSQFHVAQPILPARTTADVQSQARAVLRVDPTLNVTRTVVDHGTAAPPAHSNTQLAHRGVDKNPDAQSMAATVLLGRGA